MKKLIWWFDMIIYRLFRWRWNEKLKNNYQLRQLFIRYLKASEAIENEPAMGTENLNLKPVDKVVIILGPYRANTHRGIIENIQKAEKYAVKYWKLGYTVICPHKNTEMFDGSCTDESFLEGGKELLKRSDICVFIPNWENSKGAKEEFKLAEELNKNIIFEKEL